MPKATKPSLVVVGTPEDEETGTFAHVRTLSPKAELYAHVWPSGVVHSVVHSENEATERAALAKVPVSKRKLRQKPGKERYERNPHELVKVP